MGFLGNILGNTVNTVVGGVSNLVGGITGSVGNLVTSATPLLSNVVNSPAGTMAASALGGSTSGTSSVMSMFSPSSTSTGTSSGSKLSFFKKLFNFYQLVDGKEILTDAKGNESFNFVIVDGKKKINVMKSVIAGVVLIASVFGGYKLATRKKGSKKW